MTHPQRLGRAIGIPGSPQAVHDKERCSVLALVLAPGAACLGSLGGQAWLQRAAWRVSRRSGQVVGPCRQELKAVSDKIASLDGRVGSVTSDLGSAQTRLQEEIAQAGRVSRSPGRFSAVVNATLGRAPVRASAHLLRERCSSSDGVGRLCCNLVSCRIRVCVCVCARLRRPAQGPEDDPEGRDLRDVAAESAPQLWWRLARRANASWTS